MSHNPLIHPSSIIEPGATLGSGVKIGPFCHVGPDVVLGDECHLMSHVSVWGHTHIGARAHIFPFASVGHQPQDLKYHGEASTLIIGTDCMIREGVTINLGTEAGGMTTRIGNSCVFLANSHVAHDCQIGHNVILSNGVLVAGHCHIGDYVIVGGGAALHQFARIGNHAFIGGMSAVENDVIPYGMALGNRAYLAGLNIIGLRRRGFAREQIHVLRRAYRLLFADEGALKERVEDVAAEYASDTTVIEVIDFIRGGGDRSLCTPREVAKSNA